MDESKKLDVQQVQPKPGAGKQYLVSYRVPCPVCTTNWHIQFREAIAKMTDLYGAVGDPFKNGPGKSIRISTERWGPTALCGQCFARRIARIGPNNFLKTKTFSGWTQRDEQTLFGNLKYQQGRFHAIATVVAPATGEESLIDEQAAERERIIGKNNTFISETRARELGLEKWAWQGDA